jgi:large subunit ribosomal protein L17
MRHGVKGRHLARTAEHRKALYRNLIAALLEHGRIRTTDAKAREVRPMAEKMITLGKRGDLHARRQAVRMIGNGAALERLFGPIAERFADRPGGYTRMIKAGRRHGDAAPIAYLELLDEAPRVVRASADEEGKARADTAAGRRGRKPARPSARRPSAEAEPAEGERKRRRFGRKPAAAPEPESGKGSGGKSGGARGRGRSRKGEEGAGD